MDQVGGTNVSTQSTNNIVCHICSNVRAAAHCVDCRIYLCGLCGGHHRKYPTFDNHRVISGTKMLSSVHHQGHGNIADDLRRCSDHPQEFIKFFCASHDAVYCGICSTKRHKGCHQEYIPVLSKDYINSGDYKKVTAYLQSTDTTTNTVLKEIDHLIKKVEQLNSSQVEKLKSFKVLIVAYLDQREKKLLRAIQLTRDKDLAALKKLQSSANAIKSDLSKELANVKTHEKNSSDLFIATKRAQALLDKLQSSLNNIASRTKFQEYDLQKDPLVETLLKNKDGMAQLVTAPGLSNVPVTKSSSTAAPAQGLAPPTSASMFTTVSTDQTQVRLKRQLDIQLPEGTCRIEDLALVSPDMLLVSNWGKQRMQLLDCLKGEVVYEVQLKGWPYRICLTDRNTAAVEVGDRKIQMIKVKNKTLTKGRELTVSESIRGLTFSRNSLVVAYYDPPWLEEISIDGKVLQQFDKEAGSQYFKYPNFMCTTPSGSVFISDYGTDTITQLDDQLNILQTFTSPLLQGPCGITAVTEDQVLVCSNSNNSIVLLQPSTNTMSTLLRKDDGMEMPRSLTYCPDQKKVYVTPPQYTATIKVYQVS